MQHHLSSQYEAAWMVADLVATHGQHDFRASGDDLRTVVALCGMKVYLENQMPVRFVASDIDLVLTRDTDAQSFDNWVQDQAFRVVHNLVNAQYTLNFRKGDIAVLRSWRTRLEAFVSATAVPPRKAA